MHEKKESELIYMIRKEKFSYKGYTSTLCKVETYYKQVS